MSWANYGGRGIKVCKRWLKFENFYSDMGDAHGLTLDRIDSNGDYEPSNCRWVTTKQQSRNKRNSRFIEYNGKKQTISEWALEIGVPHCSLTYRLDAGWPIEDVFLVPFKTPSPRGKHCDECERRVLAGGKCTMHYQRQLARRRGVRTQKEYMRQRWHL
jgi:hypothetical protein